VGVRVPSGIELTLTLLSAGEEGCGVLQVVGLSKAPGGERGVPAAWAAL